MAMQNSEIAALFNKLADLLEIKGDNPFRIRAYRNAATTINSLSRSVSDLIKHQIPLDELPGIGKDLEGKIKTIVKTGKFSLLKVVEKQVPTVLSQLLMIEGLGPKRVKKLYDKLKIKNTEDLIRAIKQGKLQKIGGFGDKTIAKVLDGIAHTEQYSKRIKLADAYPIVDDLLAYLNKIKGIKNIICAGSFRRRKETVGDLDFVASSNHPEDVIHHFIHYDEIARVISKGKTRSTVRLHSGVQVDLRVVSPESYGAALLYFTGSKSYNIGLRKIAIKKGLKLNEYGVFKKNKLLAGKTEADVYRQLGLSYVEPEKRL